MSVISQAIIGHTGFVGGNLSSQESFSHHYSSATIQNIGGQTFDRIVCAGVSAVKWWANQNPEEDFAKIENLISNLSKTTASTFTLISTVDVYGTPIGVDEDVLPGREGLHAYGRNRLHLEDFVKKHFPKHHIVRLPALFGDGLRKNAIFDLMNNNLTSAINPAGSFQWYPVDRLASDLKIVEENDIPVINFATEPLKMLEIAERYFAGKALGEEKLPAPSYDFHTKYAALFNEAGNYILRRPVIWAALREYLTRTRGGSE